MSKYISSTVAFYDEDMLLWGCYVGLNNADKTLLFTVWEQSEQQAIDAAYWLKSFLNLKDY